MRVLSGLTEALDTPRLMCNCKGRSSSGRTKCALATFSRMRSATIRTSGGPVFTGARLLVTVGGGAAAAPSHIEERHMKRISFITAIVAGAVAATTSAALADGDSDKGAKAFRQCAACHTLQTGDHRTGPSLSGIWGKPAGSITTFNRYSKALKNSGIVWNAEALDRWLEDPKAMVPGNRMVFRGVAEKMTRDDLIAFLKSASEGKGQAAASGMGHHGQEMPKLKELDANLEFLRLRVELAESQAELLYLTGEPQP